MVFDYVNFETCCSDHTRPVNQYASCPSQDRTFLCLQDFHSRPSVPHARGVTECLAIARAINHRLHNRVIAITTAGHCCSYRSASQTATFGDATARFFWPLLRNYIVLIKLSRTVVIWIAKCWHGLGCVWFECNKFIFIL